MNTSRLPYRSFYWGELEAPSIVRAGELPPGLMDAFAEVVPVDGNELHAVCIPLERNRIAVCAIAKQRLEVFRGQDSLTPQEVPSFLQGKADPAGFEMLVGDYEPASIRAKRTKRHLTGAVLCLLGTAMLCAAFVRHAHASRAVSLLASEATASALMLPEGTTTVETLTTLVATDATTIDRILAAKVAAVPNDQSAAHVLAMVLSALPREVEADVTSLSVQPTLITLTVLVENAASDYVSKLGTIEGWVPQEPRTSSSSRGTRLTLQWLSKEGL